MSEKDSERAQTGGAAGRGRSRLPSEQGVQGRTQFQDLVIVAEFFSPLVPVVLGHAALKNGEVDQTEWWAAKQGLWSITKVIVQSSRGGREPKRFGPSVTFFFFRNRKILPKIHMKSQWTPNSQSNIAKEQQNWRTHTS